MIDLLALAALGIRGWFGWKRGTLLMLLSLAGLFAGYVGALFLFRPVGNYLSNTFQMSPLVALPLAGALIMGIITGGLRLGRAAVERRRGVKLQEGVQHSRLDSAGGAAIGAAWAGALVVIAAWLVMGIHGALKVGPDISRSLTGRVTSVVMRRVTYSLTRRKTGSQLVASAIALVAGQPGTGVDVVNSLMANENVRGLWTNTSVREALAHGDVNALARSPTWRALVSDTQFVHAAAMLGLGSAGLGSLGSLAGGDQLATDLVTQAGPLVRSMQSLTSDPQIRRALSSPQVARALESGNLAALINDPQIRQMMNRIMDTLKSSGTATR